MAPPVIERRRGRFFILQLENLLRVEAIIQATSDLQVGRDRGAGSLRAAEKEGAGGGRRDIQRGGSRKKWEKFRNIGTILRRRELLRKGAGIGSAECGKREVQIPLSATPPPPPYCNATIQVAQQVARKCFLYDSVLSYFGVEVG